MTSNGDIKASPRQIQVSDGLRRLLSPETARAGNLTMAWEGRAFSVTLDQLDRWCKSYPNFPTTQDIMAELQVCDDYLTEYPSIDGKVFHRVSRWLEKANFDRAEREIGRKDRERQRLRERGRAW